MELNSGLQRCKYILNIVNIGSNNLMNVIGWYHKRPIFDRIKN
jgi:hypothetical protein